MPNDFMGHELIIGDIVAYNKPRYHKIIRGIVISFGKNTVEIQRLDDKLYGYTDRKLTSEVFLDTCGWTKPTTP